MTQVTVKNVQVGDRSVYENGVAVFIAPGDSVTVDLSDAELESAQSTGYFEFGDPDDNELAAMDIDELTELAESSGVMPETGSGKGGRVLKKDIIAAIEAA